MVDPIFSAQVGSGKKVYDEITIPTWELEESGISLDDISQFDFIFQASNDNDWQDYFDMFHATYNVYH